ncbi:hypothetical protein AA3271_1713 [Gluconobacter japonicus NBRC 3271]|nr:hypothetical protein AA3271_1713 [Gluconobacter japonicus NBRC 3271]
MTVGATGHHADDLVSLPLLDAVQKKPLQQITGQMAAPNHEQTADYYFKENRKNGKCQRATEMLRHHQTGCRDDRKCQSFNGSTNNRT